MKEMNRHHQFANKIIKKTGKTAITDYSLIYPSATVLTNYWFLLKQNSQKGIQNRCKHLR